MKSFRYAVLLVPFCVFAADPVVLDLNFDGHPDQMFAVEKTKGGNRYEIRLYDPQTKTYRVDPIFSEYIVGLQPELNEKEKTIQVWLQFWETGPGYPIPGYKFLVKDGKLCFLSGKPLPEKIAWSHSGNPTPEMIAFDREAAGAEYAALQKERKALEMQFSASGIPYDRASAIRFYMEGNPENPQGFKEVEELTRRITEKMPRELIARFPDAELCKRQKEFLVSISDDWKKFGDLLLTLPQRKFVWNAKQMLLSQVSPMLSISRKMARIFQLQMQSKMDAGDVNGALEDFERSRTLLHVDGSADIEGIRLEGLSDILSRGKLTQEQLARLDDDLHREEILLRKVWRRGWYYDCAAELDAIGSFIDGTANQLARYRTPDGHALFLFAVPWTREWIFMAKFHQQSLPELTGMEYSRKHFYPGKFPRGFMLCPSIGLSVDQTNICQFFGIAQIRAARTALRHLGLKSTETPIDPFTGNPFRVRKGEFKVADRMVRGIRFYSAGPDGKYTDGTDMAPGNKSDDIGFDLLDR